LTGPPSVARPVNGARLFLLRHYYLETPEAAAADPGVQPVPADRLTH
jgi:hypothetical protein